MPRMSRKQRRNDAIRRIYGPKALAAFEHHGTLDPTGYGINGRAILADYLAHAANIRLWKQLAIARNQVRLAREYRQRQPSWRWYAIP